MYKLYAIDNQTKLHTRLIYWISQHWEWSTDERKAGNLLIANDNDRNQTNVRINFDLSKTIFNDYFEMHLNTRCITRQIIFKIFLKCYSIGTCLSEGKRRKNSIDSLNTKKESINTTFDMSHDSMGGKWKSLKHIE